MVTIYDLLEVDEKASKEEIDKSYQKLILEYHKDPNLSQQENDENELILNKMKIAYEILSDDEKRAKYDKELAKKRAEELLKNVSVSSSSEEETVVEEPKQSTNNVVSKKNNDYAEQDSKYDDSIEYNSDLKDEIDIVENTSSNNVSSNASMEGDLSKEEQQKIVKAAQDEFKANLKKAQKAEEEYNKAYNEAYNDYMRKMGYKEKRPWTLKRVKNIAIFVIAIVIVCFLCWVIPPIRNIFVNLYNENVIIKALVDIVKAFFGAIFSVFK